jgi:hypothetical protein
VLSEVLALRTVDEAVSIATIKFSESIGRRLSTMRNFSVADQNELNLAAASRNPTIETPIAKILTDSPEFSMFSPELPLGVDIRISMAST